MKVCAHCKIPKEETEFNPKKYYSRHKSGKTWMGLCCYCKECDRILTIERQKKTYQRHKQDRLKYQQEYCINNIKEVRKKNRLYAHTHPEKYKIYRENFKKRKALLHNPYFNLGLTSEQGDYFSQ